MNRIWRVKSRRYIVSSDNELIADAYPDSAEDYDLPQDYQANARLIAVAPELLQRVKAVQDILVGRGLISHDPDMNELFNLNAQVIARAEGRS